MELVLRGLTWDACLIYLDDSIIFSSTFRQHLVRLQLVLHCLRQAGLKLSPIKCHFCETQVNHLGHQVSKRGISTDPSKWEEVLNWSTPNTVKEVKASLGIASYYRRFIDNFAHVASPLNKLTRKEVRGKRWKSRIHSTCVCTICTYYTLCWSKRSLRCTLMRS